MRKNILILLLSAVMFAVLLTGCGAEAQEEKELFTVDILSTGKSDCALIRMDELVILSDTGEANDYDTIATLLRDYGIERIDYVILSHYDKDHIGSAAALIRSFDVGTVLRPNYRENSEEYHDLVDAVFETETESITLTENYIITTANGQITVDPPDRDYGDDNNNSLVTTFEFKGHRLLFLGDAQKQRMEEFVETAEESYDFIKLPHHGDSNKPLLRLLQNTKPQWAAETVGRASDVERELLAETARLEIQLFCTCDGPVSLYWDGETLQAAQTTD